MEVSHLQQQYPRGRRGGDSGRFTHDCPPEDRRISTWLAGEADDLDFPNAKNRAIDYHRVSRPEYLELTEEMGEPQGAREGVCPGRNRDKLNWLLDELNSPIVTNLKRRRPLLCDA